MSPRPSMRPARVSKRVEAFVRGIKKHVVAGLKVTVAGVEYDQAALLARFAPVQQVNLDLAAARSVVNQIVHNRERLHEDIRPFMANLAQGCSSIWGVDNPLLGDFGVPYVKPRRQLTAAQKTIAALEGVRTRRLRGSYTSKKQRRETTVAGKPGLSLIDPKGNVTEILPPAPPRKGRPKRK